MTKGVMKTDNFFKNFKTKFLGDTKKKTKTFGGYKGIKIKLYKKGGKVKSKKKKGGAVKKKYHHGGRVMGGQKKPKNQKC